MTALVVAMAGAGLSLYGKMQGVDWANRAGTVLLFGGAIAYVIERFRSARQKLD